MSSFNFHSTANEVASFYSAAIKDSVVLITGASPRSIGAEFAVTIAKHEPSLIILAGRDSSKIHQTAAAIAQAAPSVQTRALALDLSSFKGIREASADLNKDQNVKHIDVLVNSAGVMAGGDRRTSEGIELQFGVNHIGHFLFTNLIMNKLIPREDRRSCRVVNVSSVGYEVSPIRFDDWNFKLSGPKEAGGSYHQWLAYGQSKTANMLFSVSLAAKLQHQGIESVSLNPGPTKTGLSAHLSADDWAELAATAHEQGNPKFYRQGFSYKTPAQAAATYVYAAFATSTSTSSNNGVYIQDCQVVDTADVRCWARDPVEAERLWTLSEDIVGEKFGYTNISS